MAGSSSRLSTTQNALSTSAEVIVAANGSRKRVHVKNMDGTISVFLGDDATVTSSNGYELKAGQSIDMNEYHGALWAIAASGTPSICTIEW